MSRGAHGAYRIFLCPTCHFGVPANHWRAHRRACAGLAICSTCRDSFPCRKPLCPEKEKRVEIADEEPGAAPTGRVVRSLEMSVARLEDGSWSIRAPWLDGPVIAATWPEAYWAAVKVRNG